jgi:serine/threonine protein kinase
LDLGSAIVSMGGFRSEHSRPEIQADGLHYCTLWYRAPEICLGDDSFSFPADVWSAGCIWAETLTSKGLFQETTAAGILLRIFRAMGSPRGETEKYFVALPLWCPKYPIFSKGSLAADLGMVPPAVVNELRSALALSPFDRKTADGMLPFFAAGVCAAEASCSVPPSAASASGGVSPGLAAAVDSAAGTSVPKSCGSPAVEEKASEAAGLMMTQVVAQLASHPFLSKSPDGG